MGVHRLFFAGGYLLQVRGGSVIAISDDPDFVSRLYRAATMVFAAQTGGRIVAPFAAP